MRILPKVNAANVNTTRVNAAKVNTTRVNAAKFNTAKVNAAKTVKNVRSPLSARPRPAKPRDIPESPMRIQSPAPIRRRDVAESPAPLPQPEQPFYETYPTPISNPKRIGSGTYGCVYRPIVKCADGSNLEDDDRYVSKLTSGPNAREEEYVMMKIDKIDPTGIFHYQLVKHCTTEFKPVSCNNCGKRKGSDCHDTCCDANLTVEPQQRKKEDKTLHLLIYEDGGTDLLNVNSDLDYVSKPYHIRNLFLGLWRLFVGLYVMHNNDYYHFDIKPNNIVVKELPGETIVKYIDFGMAKTGEKLNEMNETGAADYMFIQPYIFYPIEAFLISKYWNDAIVKAVPSNFERFEISLKQNMTAHVKGRVALGRYKSGAYEKVRGLNQITNSKLWNLKDYDNSDEFESYQWGQSINGKRLHKLLTTPIENRERKQPLQRAIYTRVDVSMLGTTLKIFLAVMNNQGYTDQDEKFAVKLSKLANKMEHPDPFMRYGPNESLGKYMKIVKKVYGVDTDMYAIADKMIPQERLDRMSAKYN